jgi:capsid protein
MQSQFKTIETLVGENTKLVEVELMLTPAELQKFAAHCIKNEIKFNDWIRQLAYDTLEKGSSADA